MTNIIIVTVTTFMVVVVLISRHFDRKQILGQVPRFKTCVMQELIKAGGTPVRRYSLGLQITLDRWALQALDIALKELVKEGHVRIEPSEPTPFLEDEEMWDKRALEYVAMTTKGYRTYRELKKAA